MDVVGYFRKVTPGGRLRSILLVNFKLESSKQTMPTLYKHLSIQHATTKPPTRGAEKMCLEYRPLNQTP